MRPEPVPKLDIAGTRKSVRLVIERECPEHATLARSVLDRLDPSRWTLEWFLPWWLSHRFALGDEIARDLVLANVFGLAAVRLRDDVIDGEIEPGDTEAAEAIATALFDEALGIYRRRFDQASPVWAYLADAMKTWHRVTSAQAPTHICGPGRGKDRSAWQPAHLGAPVKIAAFAACLLADRPADFAALDRCLDHVLHGLVRYDHLRDWEADLRGGRWNAFVARVTARADLSRDRSRDRTRMLVGLITTDAIGVEFASIDRELAEAVGIAEALDIPHLTTWLMHLRMENGQQARRMQAHYQALGACSARLLLDPTRASGW